MNGFKLFGDEAKRVLEAQGLYENGDTTKAIVRVTRTSVEGRTIAEVEWVL